MAESNDSSSWEILEVDESKDCLKLNLIETNLVSSEDSQESDKTGDVHGSVLAKQKLYDCSVVESNSTGFYVIDPSSESKLIKFREIIKFLKSKIIITRPKLEVANFIGAEKDYLLKQEIIDYMLNEVVPTTSLTESQKYGVEEVLRQTRLKLKIQYSGIVIATPQYPFLRILELRHM